jgi:alpha-L-rhamnosidase
MRIRVVTIRLAIALLTLSSAAWGQGQLAVKNLRVEQKVNPLGIDETHPRLSWELASTDRGVLQTSYEIRVTTSGPKAVRQRVAWESGKVASDASNQVSYAGEALESGRAYSWQVRVADNHGHISEWSTAGTWEVGLLKPSDWKARWITANLPEEEGKSNPSPMLRRDFAVKKKVARARLYATAMGLYELHLNGQRVGDQFFTPGWTAYDFRYQYQTYDVSALLRPGANCIGAILGDGWYRGVMTWDLKRNSYGKKLALLSQLVITYDDGTQEVVTSDSQWKAATGPILMSDIYDGENYDARLEKKGWDAAGFADKDWKTVTETEAPKSSLVAPAGPPVKAVEEIKPIKVLKTPNGDAVLDMGQNMVGWVRFRLTAPAGTIITLRHAEVLGKDGNLYTDNLRGAKEVIRYVAKGGGVEQFEPHFSFQGFRYVAVKDWPGELNLDDFRGEVVYSAIRQTGNFESSSALLNQLEHNILWGQKGNFVDVPTDCPQRDERLGWTGDAQVFAPTASFNFDTEDFYTKWLKDVALDQQDDGAVPHVIPNVLTHETRKGSSASAGWADVAVVVPWTVYQSFGDRRILETQYPSMKAWVEYIRRQAGDKYIWSTGFSYGDWLAYATTNSDYPGATTDKDFIQTAYFAYSTELLAKAAAVLGKTNDVEEYNALEGKIRQAFQHEFVTSNGRISPNTQTAYAIALEFDLVPQEMRAAAAARLAADVRKFGHLTTGFLGTPLLCDALSRNGYLDEAYMLLNRTEYPSWLYPVTKGATTIWERWDGITPEGDFQAAGMNSFNHYAYGAIGSWMYRVVAGIQIDEATPGYKHIVIAPQPGGGLTNAKASVDSIYGPVSVQWELKDAKLTMNVEIPANTTATVRIPKSKSSSVTVGGSPLVGAPGTSDSKQDGESTVVEIGSGQYKFQSDYSN